MNVEITQDGLKRTVEVTLSDTNVMELAKKVSGFPPNSERTLERWVDDDRTVLLRVIAEPDEVHYNSEKRNASVRGSRGVTFSEYQSGDATLLDVFTGVDVRPPGEEDPA